MHATIDELTHRAWDLRHADPSQAQILAVDALALLPEGGYAQGEADALRTLAWCKMHQGVPAEALPVALRALDLYSQLNHCEGESYLRYLLGMISWRMGNLDTALDYMLSSLRRAQSDAGCPHQVDLRTWIAIHSGLGGLYFDQGDYEKSMQYIKQVLTLATDETTTFFRAEALNNLAFLYCRTGHPQEGLPYLLESLQILERLETNFGWLSSLHTAGVLYMALHNYEMARHYLERGLHIAQTYQIQVSISEFAMELGRLAQKQRDYPLATAYMQEALAIAVQMQAPLHQAQIHRALTDLYAEQGAFEQALAHHQRFHQYHQQVFNESSARRLHALQVIHEVELAKKEAEIYRLQTHELKAEIVRQEEIEQQLQKIVRQDFLVDAYNRRYFFDLAEEMLAQSQIQQQPVGLLIIDIDHFKQINDIYGHLAADRVLEGVVVEIKALLHPNEILARYGGDEFVVLMIDTSLTRCQDLGRSIVHSLPTQPFLPDGKSVTVSIGSTFNIPSAETTTLKGLIERADQALYTVKRQGRNGFQLWAPMGQAIHEA